MNNAKFLRSLRKRLIKLECLAAQECGFDSEIAKTERYRNKTLKFVADFVAEKARVN